MPRVIPPGGGTTVRRLSPRRNGAENPHVSRESTPTQALQELHLATLAPPRANLSVRVPLDLPIHPGWSIGRLLATLRPDANFPRRTLGSRPSYSDRETRSPAPDP